MTFNYASSEQRENKFKTQRRMFPTANVHYSKHYDIGFANFPLVKKSEYQLRYPAYPNASALRGRNLNRSTHDACVYSYEQERDGTMIEDRVMERAMPTAVLNCQSVDKGNYREANFDYKNYTDNNVAPPTATQQMPSDDRLREVKNLLELKYSSQAHNNVSPKEYIVPSIEPKTKVADVEYFDENTPKAAEQHAIHATILGDALCYEKDSGPVYNSVNAPSDAKSEDKERKLRAKKYKEYLDLQIRLKTEKEQYEKHNRVESNKMYRQRDVELKKIEKETLAKDRMLKDQLAEFYRRQMEEQASLRKGRSVERTDQNDFCGFLDINRKRYLQKLDDANQKQELIYRRCLNGVVQSKDLVAPEEINGNAKNSKMIAEDKKQKLYKSILDEQVREKCGITPTRRRPKYVETKDYYDLFLPESWKEREAQAMEIAMDPRRSDPILNPIPRSDNPYLSLKKAESNVLQDAAKNLLIR